MKKLVGLSAVVIFLFFCFSSAEAKFYQPLSTPNYTPEFNVAAAEIPDDVVLPSRLSYLENIGPFIEGDPNIAIFHYNPFSDPEFKYFTENGKESFPYIEILKWQYEENTAHLVVLIFINDKGELEMYADETADEKPAIDKLRKIGSESRLFYSDYTKSVKKVPREK